MEANQNFYLTYISNTHLSSKIDAVHNQNQILPVNEENENQIPKPKQQHHGDLLQELHTEPQKNNLGRTSAAMRRAKLGLHRDLATNTKTSSRSSGRKQQ
jgi:hypothetical protein